jgi:uncharacterized protein YjdB
LDLQSDNLGFKLPVIELGDVAVFQLLGTEDEADGIMIYNSSDATTGGSGKGIYVWNGSKWNFAGKSGQIVPADIPVKNIKITSAGYATELKASGVGNTLQLTATVEPAEASQEVIWSKVYNLATTAGDVTVDATGLVTGVKTGNVTVRATATDGSGVYRDLALKVKATTYANSITIDPVNGEATIEVGKTVQLQATVLPEDALADVIWSVDNGSVASVSISGLVNGISEGSATITATSIDPGKMSGTYDLTVTASTEPPLVFGDAIIGGNTYKTYNFGGTVWTVDNMSHGTPIVSLYNNDPEKPVSYYNNVECLSLCTDGFVLPTFEQYQLLVGYLKSSDATPNEYAVFFPANAMIGYCNTAGTTFGNWGDAGYFWTQGTIQEAIGINTSAGLWKLDRQNYGYAVKCVAE